MQTLGYLYSLFKSTQCNRKQVQICEQTDTHTVHGLDHAGMQSTKDIFSQRSFSCSHLHVCVSRNSFNLRVTTAHCYCMLQHCYCKLGTYNIIEFGMSQLQLLHQQYAVCVYCNLHYVYLHNWFQRRSGLQCIHYNDNLCTIDRSWPTSSLLLCNLPSPTRHDRFLVQSDSLYATSVPPQIPAESKPQMLRYCWNVAGLYSYLDSRQCPNPHCGIY